MNILYLFIVLWIAYFVTWAIWDDRKTKSINNDLDLLGYEKRYAKMFLDLHIHPFNWVKYARKSNFDLYRLYHRKIWRA